MDAWAGLPRQAGAAVSNPVGDDPYGELMPVAGRDGIVIPDHPATQTMCFNNTCPLDLPRTQCAVVSRRRAPGA